MRNAENLGNRTDFEEEVVNTQGPKGVQSILKTQTNNIRVQEYHLMEKVVDRPNLKKALERVERNKGAPGIDGMEVQNLRGYLKQNWARIKQQLLDGTYKPSPVRRVEIPKPGGGIRLLGIPTVVDRFIQQAIQQTLTTIFEPQFSNSSYGFRPKRSAIQAVKRAQEHIQAGNKIVIDIDLEKFFDRVNHDKLMLRLARSVDDKRVLRIIRRYLQSGVMINGICVTTEEGTPQGGPISPLLSNIVLDELDKELEKRGHKHVRYADDCNIYIKSKRAAERVYESIAKFIKTKLMLKVNTTKSAIDSPNKRKFLGFTFITDQALIIIAPQSIVRFKERIRKLTSRTRSISMKMRIEKLNEYLKGWSGYFSRAECKRVSQELDQWIRRRMRACLIKQWKLCKTKLQNLKNLGIPEDWGYKIAYSRKKYWRLSNTPQISKALSLTYWENQGLVKLLDRYHEMRATL